MAEKNVRTKNRFRAFPRVEGATDDVRALVEVVEQLVGAGNDTLNRAITLGDLLGTGLFGNNGDNIYTLTPGDPTVPPNSPPSFPPGTPPIITPPIPQNFSATGTFSAVNLTWSYPSGYYGLAYTAIYRSSVDNLSTAVLIQTAIGRFATDSVVPGSRYYYWVRFANVLGELGPVNSTAGTLATTALTVTDIMESMADLVSWENLTTSLQDEIQLGGQVVETFLDTNWSLESARDVGGNIRISGMKLIGGEEQSKIIFSTDVFYVGPPFTPGAPDLGDDDAFEPVFLIGPWTDDSDPDNPVTTQRVVMSSAVIGDLTVRDAAIENLRADKITIGGIPGNPSSIAEVIIGEADITNLHIGYKIQSDNFNPAFHQGFKLVTGPFPYSSMEIYGSFVLKDTNGGTIIDAGTNTYSQLIRNSAQQWAQVQGRPDTLEELNRQEWLKLNGIDFNATKNDIIYSNTAPSNPYQGKPLSAGDLWWNQSQGELHNWNPFYGWLLVADDTLSHFETMGGINSVNAGTYIANAAIGTLFFQDSVLIVPLIASGGSMSFQQAEVIQCSVGVTIPNVGQGTQAVSIQWFVNVSGQNNNSHSMNILIKRRVWPNGAWTNVYTANTNDKDEWMSGLQIDYPAKGIGWEYGLFIGRFNETSVYIYSTKMLVQVIKR